MPDNLVLQEIDNSSGVRIETGPLRIGDDWAGIFIRGDDCLGLAAALNSVIEELSINCNVLDIYSLRTVAILTEVADLLKSSSEQSIREANQAHEANSD